MKHSIDIRLLLFAYILGVSVTVLFPSVPSVVITLVIGCIGVLLIGGGCFYRIEFVVVGCACVGVFIGVYHGLQVQKGWINPDDEGRVVSISGYLTGLSVVSESSARFDLMVERWDSVASESPAKIRLTWYFNKSCDESLSFVPGDRFKLQVKLRHPRGYASEKAFDKEAWAVREGIKAIGYVKAGELCSSKVNGPGVLMDRFRFFLRDWLRQHASSGAAALFSALLLGDKSGVTQEQWLVLNRTGTTHLIVISGLHIGLVAGLVFFLIRLPGRLGVVPLTLIDLDALGIWMALLFATGYALLSGFNVPVQRALVMMSVALSGKFLGCRPRPSTLILFALALVLTLEPLALMSEGFWLSFTAVGILLFGLVGRVPESSKRKRSGLIFKPQGLVFVVLLPLLLFHQQTVCLLSPLINFLAIPFIGLLVVPLLFIALPLGFFLGSSGLFLLHWLDEAIWLWMQGLQWLSEAAFPVPVIPLNMFSVILSLLAAYLVVSPSSLGLRPLVSVLLLPALFPAFKPVNEGEARVSVLDVGQGLSVLIQTRSHALLYDTGEGGPGRPNMVDHVIMPLLNVHGINRLDQVIISHGDNDHSGGLPRLLEAMPEIDVMLGSPLPTLSGRASPCLPGINWTWDGVRFEILEGCGSWAKTNDRSCVLRVVANEQVLLLTGDISQRIEKKMLSDGRDIQADVLLLPHHGSRYSSHEAFLRRVGASAVLVSTGYKNRFHHPAPEVVDNVLLSGASFWNTADHGTLNFTLGNGDCGVVGFWERNRRYWRRCLSL